MKMFFKILLFPVFLFVFLFLGFFECIEVLFYHIGEVLSDIADEAVDEILDGMEKFCLRVSDAFTKRNVYAEMLLDPYPEDES